MQVKDVMVIMLQLPSQLSGHVHMSVQDIYKIDNLSTIFVVMMCAHFMPCSMPSDFCYG